MTLPLSLSADSCSNSHVEAIRPFRERDADSKRGDTPGKCLSAGVLSVIILLLLLLVTCLHLLLYLNGWPSPLLTSPGDMRGSFSTSVSEGAATGMTSHGMALSVPLPLTHQQGRTTMQLTSGSAEEQLAEMKEKLADMETRLKRALAAASTTESLMQGPSQSSSQEDIPRDPLPARYTVPSTVHPLSSLNFSNARVMVVSFVSLPTFHELYDFFPPLDRHFLHPHQTAHGMGSRLNFTIFYEIFPQDTSAEMKRWLQTMKLRHVSGRRDENGGLEVFRSALGSIVQIQPLAMNLPDYIADDISLTFREDWMKCGRNKTFSFNYVFYNTVFTYHILRHRLLDGYDYYMKLDTDIIFIRDIPFSLFGDMSDKQCLFAHAKTQHAWANCQWRSTAAMFNYSKAHAIIPRSGHYPWCHDETFYFYGNFVVGYLGLLRSVECLDFLDFMFHGWPEGYFKHRWTDQAIWPKVMCMFADLPDVEKDKQICDYTWWRGGKDKVFKHV